MIAIIEIHPKSFPRKYTVICSEILLTSSYGYAKRNPGQSEFIVKPALVGLARSSDAMP